jgi:hypothetical protein
MGPLAVDDSIVFGPKEPCGKRALWALRWLDNSTVFGPEAPWGRQALWAQQKLGTPVALYFLGRISYIHENFSK